MEACLLSSASHRVSSRTDESTNHMYELEEVFLQNGDLLCKKSASLRERWLVHV